MRWAYRFRASISTFVQWDYYLGSRLELLPYCTLGEWSNHSWNQKFSASSTLRNVESRMKYSLGLAHVFLRAPMIGGTASPHALNELIDHWKLLLLGCYVNIMMFPIIFLPNRWESYHFKFQISNRWQSIICKVGRYPIFLPQPLLYRNSFRALENRLWESVLPKPPLDWDFIQSTCSTF